MEVSFILTFHFTNEFSRFSLIFFKLSGLTEPGCASAIQNWSFDCRVCLNTVWMSLELSPVITSGLAVRSFRSAA